MPVFLLKSVMPMSEYAKWLIYLKDDDPDVTEIQLAVLSTLVSNGLGGKAKVKDFIIRKKDQMKPKDISANDLRSAFGGLVKKAK